MKFFTHKFTIGSILFLVFSVGVISILVINNTREKQIADTRSKAAGFCSGGSLAGKSCTGIFFGPNDVCEGRSENNCKALQSCGLCTWNADQPTQPPTPPPGASCTEGYLSLDACCGNGMRARTYRFSNCTTESRCNYPDASCQLVPPSTCDFSSQTASNCRGKAFNYCVPGSCQCKPVSSGSSVCGCYPVNGCGVAPTPTPPPLNTPVVPYPTTQQCKTTGTCATINDCCLGYGCVYNSTAQSSVCTRIFSTPLPTPTSTPDPSKCSWDSDPTCIDRGQCSACTLVDSGGGSGQCKMSSIPGRDGRAICTCLAPFCSGTIPGVTATPPIGGGPTNPPQPTTPPGPTNPPTNPTATRTPTPRPTATRTPTPRPTATRTPTPRPTATRTPTPRPTNTPTPTPIPQCLNLKIYKGGVVVTNPNTLRPGDSIVIAVVATQSTGARIKINNEATFRTSTTKNTAGEVVFPAYTIPATTNSAYSIYGEAF